MNLRQLFRKFIDKRLAKAGAVKASKEEAEATARLAEKYRQWAKEDTK